MSDKLQQIGRITLRREGDWWVGRFAPLPGMAGEPLELARMRISLAEANPSVKQLFIDLTQAMMSTAIRAAFGVETLWPAPKRAPEAERGGHV